MLDFPYVALFVVMLFVYAWSLYNLPILVAGVRNLRRTKRKDGGESVGNEGLPVFSIIVPVKNEGKVVGRLLDALSKLRYPVEKTEVIIVEDGSTDGSLDVCVQYAEQNVGRVKILHKPFSCGKPSALNYAVKEARGDIIAVFDADNVPAEDVLVNVCKYFEDPKVAAVQGRTLSINSQENMLTRFIAHEETVWCEAYLGGKDVLNLFVHLKGSCQFFRRDVLQKLRGFDEKALSEDMEISARLAEGGYKIRYASDVRSWQESPGSVKSLFRQRLRWFRGTMEVAFKYGRLMSKPSMRNFDAEVTLVGPFVLIAALSTYFATFFTFFEPLPFNFLLQFVIRSSALVATLTLLSIGVALIYSTKPREAKSVLWLPFIYFYWSLQAFISFYAVLLIMLRRPRNWNKTAKTGAVNEANIQA